MFTAPVQLSVYTAEPYHQQDTSFCYIFYIITHFFGLVNDFG